MNVKKKISFAKEEKRITKLEKWLSSPIKWDNDRIRILRRCLQRPRHCRPKFYLKDLLHRSEDFPIKFPLHTPRCRTLRTFVNLDTLQRNIDSAYPLIHETALYLFLNFLVYMRRNGTDVEKRLYKNMTVLQFVNRLLMKKAAAFDDPAYKYLLVDGTTGVGEIGPVSLSGWGQWNFIGTTRECYPLILENCLSNDEIKLASYISTSSYSYFINRGQEENVGRILKNRNIVQEEGVIVSLVPPKINVPNLYDYQDIIITQNKIAEPSKRLYSFFMLFYDLPTDNLKKYYDENWEMIGSETWFNNDIYSKRLAVSIDMFLFEANYRAEKANKMAYVHLSGIGLGNASISFHQEKVFVDTVKTRLKVIGKYLKSISDIHFSDFPQTCVFSKMYNDYEYFEIPDHPTGIYIHFFDRDPFNKLQDPKKLLVVSYSADANALPGNGFWKGYLRHCNISTAVATASQITELHNPHINRNIRADNLMIVSSDGQIKKILEYIQSLDATE